MPVLDPVAQDYVSVNASTTVKNRPGRLFKVIVTVAGSGGNLTIYDNTSATGTVLFTIVGTQAVGTIYDLNLPCKVGIHVVPGTGQTVVVSYT